MRHLMKSISVRYNSSGIIHQTLYRTPWDILSVEHKMSAILSRLVWNECHVILPGRSWAHIHGNISAGAPALNGQFP